jgi:hypothetical protein
MSRKTTLIEIAQAAAVSPAREVRVLEWASRLNFDRVMFRDISQCGRSR